MDRTTTEEARIQELIRVSQVSRRAVGEEVTDIRRKLDVPMRLKDSLRHRPGAWLAGSAVAGVATSLLLGRRAKRRKKSPKRMNPLLGLTLTAARPLIKVWLGNKLKQWAITAVSRQQQTAPTTPFNTNPDNKRSHVSPHGPRPR